ncbi:facilitated trehalose transporter Tret1-like, partial [Schistocerca serialis cubense]|uniref:facilitated trehalose transporter Tret1-like n=1 Tax=Schistocerca serialis cubense TaxID=2023355 RepID=UPI00214E568C
ALLGPVPPPPPPPQADRRLAWRRLRAELLVAGACFLLTVVNGFPIGFSAVLLPQLRSNASSLPTSDDMCSWIASIHSAVTPLGALSSSWFSERLGRRATLQLTVLPNVLGWLLLALARDHAVLLAGRAVCGFAVGLAVPPTQVYLGETSEPRVRGMLAGSPMVSYSLAILVVYTLGSWLEWHTVAWINTALPLVALAAVSLVPESPVWLARNGRLEQARRALTWLRGGRFADPHEVEGVLQEMVSRMHAEQASLAAEARSGKARPSLLQTFLQPRVYRPVLIVNLVNMAQIFSGTFMLIFYSVDLIREADEAGEVGVGGEFGAAVLTAAVRLAVAVLACALLLWLGRRPMAVGAGAATAAAACAVAAVCRLREARPPGRPAAPGEAPALVACLLLYIAANTAGFFVLPIVATGELLPARVRGIAGGYIYFFFNLVLFAVAKLFPVAVRAVGVSGVFWAFGAFSLLGTVLMYLAVPETKGRTLNEVEDYFDGENALWVTRRKGSEFSNRRAAYKA